MDPMKTESMNAVMIPFGGCFGSNEIQFPDMNTCILQNEESHWHAVF